ncbi:MAG: hypothetical protein C3F14_00705 [Deltaproteobacteria bacterium]|nr:MAG: hypothetical protein C3F14_00705 [Deltaproteobacteria bacterium]
MAAGCATANAIQNARASLDRAKAAGADTKAPYEYYSAEAYLKKADIQAEKGDCRAVKAYAKDSMDFSAKALQLSAGGVK